MVFIMYHTLIIGKTIKVIGTKSLIKSGILMMTTYTMREGKYLIVNTLMSSLNMTTRLIYWWNMKVNINKFKLGIAWLIIIFTELIGVPLLATLWSVSHSDTIFWLLIGGSILVVITSILVVITMRDKKPKKVDRSSECPYFIEKD